MTKHRNPDKPAGEPEPQTTKPTPQALDEFETALLESLKARRDRVVDGPFIPGEVMRAHMREWLEEWDRLGGFDMAYMKVLRKKQMDRDQPLFFYHVKRLSAPGEDAELAGS